MGLIHAPELLFLDEPSTGLDPQNRANLQEHVLALRERYGTTIVITTHYLEEADAIAERVVVVDHGLIIADDSPVRLKAEVARDKITFRSRVQIEAIRAGRRVGRLDRRSPRRSTAQSSSYGPRRTIPRAVGAAGPRRDGRPSPASRLPGRRSTTCS